jgi:hypothetical protein
MAGGEAADEKRTRGTTGFRQLGCAGKRRKAGFSIFETKDSNTIQTQV